MAAVLRMAAVSMQRSHSALGAAFRRRPATRLHRGGLRYRDETRDLGYRMLRYGQNYLDIGEKEYEARSRRQRLAGLEAAAKSLAYELVKSPDKTSGPNATIPAVPPLSALAET